MIDKFFYSRDTVAIRALTITEFHSIRHSEKNVRKTLEQSQVIESEVNEDNWNTVALPSVVVEFRAMPLSMMASEMAGIAYTGRA